MILTPNALGPVVLILKMFPISVIVYLKKNCFQNCIMVVFELYDDKVLKLFFFYCCFYLQFWSLALALFTCNFHHRFSPPQAEILLFSVPFPTCYRKFEEREIFFVKNNVLLGCLRVLIFFDETKTRAHEFLFEIW